MSPWYKYFIPKETECREYIISGGNLRGSISCPEEFLAGSHFYTMAVTATTMAEVIGERSEPLSDKLGGEICIATRVLVCIFLLLCVRPDDRTLPTLYVACAARAK